MVLDGAHFLFGETTLTDRQANNFLDQEISVDKKGVGTLYGVGVGPGDPDLLTVKALNILRTVPMIFAACSSKNDYSIAENIIRKHIPDRKIEKLPFPMCNDKSILEEAWIENGQRVLASLKKGLDCAFLTLGDPLTYSTFSYLFRTIKKTVPELEVVSVPGITSFQAAASAANIPLSEGEETLAIVSGAKGGLKLEEVIKAADNVVMLKTYRQFEDIYNTLENLNMLSSATFLCNLGSADQAIITDMSQLKNSATPYLSLIIVKKKSRLSQ